MSTTRNWYKLAESAPNITLQKFQAMTWEKKRALAQSMELSLSQRVQLLFFTEEYEGKDNILWPLAENTSISPQAQLLFFTQEYRSKENILYTLRHSPSFLKRFTLQQLREFTKIKEARLTVYKKRFKAVKAMVLL